MSVCLINNHPKDTTRNAHVPLVFKLRFRCRRVVNSRPGPFTTWKDLFRYPLRTSVDMTHCLPTSCVKEKNLLPSPGIEHTDRNPIIIPNDISRLCLRRFFLLRSQYKPRYKTLSLNTSVCVLYKTTRLWITAMIRPSIRIKWKHICSVTKENIFAKTAFLKKIIIQKFVGGRAILKTYLNSLWKNI